MNGIFIGIHTLLFGVLISRNPFQETLPLTVCELLSPVMNPSEPDRLCHLYNSQLLLSYAKTILQKVYVFLNYN